MLSNDKLYFYLHWNMACGNDNKNNIMDDDDGTDGGVIR